MKKRKTMESNAFPTQSWYGMAMDGIGIHMELN